ncbi:MAG: formate dehydrogenase, partial [Rhodoferax sp.]
MTLKVHIPCDSAALALGADALARAVQAAAQDCGLAIELRRTSSRGLFWLEPLIEIDTDQGRLGYAGAMPQEAPSLCAAWQQGEHFRHPRCVGLVEEMAYLKRQQRLVFARMGITRPLSLPDYCAHGGYQGLAAALRRPAAAVVQEV